MINTYEDALAFIHGRGKFKKIPTLKRMQRFMDLLGDPQTKIRPIHVAGTNGKGSTVAFLRSLFEQQNLTVGTFTSPFLIKFNERISVNGIPITDNEVTELARKVKPIVDQLDQELPEGGPTEFEIVTAMMFIYFASHPVDVVIVEVGIGGLYDSTNVLTPALSIITTIGYDHMQILGNTLTEIATQKAGIIKPGVPVVVGNIGTEATAAILKVAEQNGAPVSQLGREFNYRNLVETQSGEQFDFINEQTNISQIKTQLIGNYQVDNAVTAIQAFELYQRQQQKPFTVEMVKRGIQVATWPGRFEIIQQSPMVIIDGAHNIPAIEALVSTLKTQFTKEPISILVAVLADKQAEKMMSRLLTVENVELYLTTFNAPKNRQVSSITKLAQSLNSRRVHVVENWQTGLAELIKNQPDKVILVTGSLYFISDVRRWLVK